MTSTTTRRAVCFGEALIDFVAEPPTAGRPRAFLQHAGGAPANVAVALARLGDAVEFVGMLGADAFGDFIAERLRAFGVGTAHVRRTDAAPTALAFVSIDAAGERSFAFYRPPAADLLFRDEHFDAASFDACGVFHACSNSLTEAAIAETTLSGMRRARAAGALVSFDVNLRPALWPRDVDPLPRVRAALALADLVKLSREELAFLARDRDEEAALASLWTGATRLAVVTDGAAPVRWHTPDRHGTVPTFAVTAVDSNAAGDAFVGGLLHALLGAGIAAAELPAFAADAARRDAALRFAAACGAHAVTRAGAFAAMPARDEVEALLAARARPREACR
ncbi:MAG TPA: carbohydrate kinase [Dokdonella sp.]